MLGRRRKPIEECGEYLLNGRGQLGWQRIERAPTLRLTRDQPQVERSALTLERVEHMTLLRGRERAPRLGQPVLKCCSPGAHLKGGECEHLLAREPATQCGQ